MNMNTFCVLPWYSVELPSASPCCLLPKNTNIQQLKKDLLAGVKSNACSKCWTIESTGNLSRRQLENQFLDYKLDRDLDKIQQDCQDNKNTALLYQITTSNLCNQACVSCGSGASTKWAELDRKNNLTMGNRNSLEIESLNIDYAKIQRLSLLGGEPLFDPKTYEILQNLINHNNTNCFVTMITNGSINFNSSQTELLKKFTDLNICISIDGTESVFEYMRWPGNWKKLVENLNHYLKITSNISISYTISALNALYHDQTTEWFNKNNLRYNHNIVDTPDWLSVKNMPVEFKELLKNHDFFKKYCAINGQENSLSTLGNQILKQDQLKKISIQDYMPAVAKIIFNTV
jgi:MoaA/NifB/PqqE/SkfB family radical SAM enzyme